jgi:competence protein ComEA
MKCSALVLVIALALASSIPVIAQQAEREGATKPAPTAAAAAATQVINLNTATASQIAGLPGIGPKTADLIVQYRQKNGNFKKVEEIMNVRGIGEKTFLKLKTRITVAPVN